MTWSSLTPPLAACDAPPLAAPGQFISLRSIRLHAAVGFVSSRNPSSMALSGGRMGSAGCSRSLRPDRSCYLGMPSEWRSMDEVREIAEDHRHRFRRQTPSPAPRAAARRSASEDDPQPTAAPEPSPRWRRRGPSPSQSRLVAALERVEEQFQRLAKHDPQRNERKALADALELVSDVRVRDLIDKRAKESCERCMQDAVALFAPLRDAVVEVGTCVADMDDWLQQTLWPIICDSPRDGGRSRIEDTLDSAVQRALVRLAGRGTLQTVLAAAADVAEPRTGSCATAAGSSPRAECGLASSDSRSLRSLRRALRDQLAEERLARETETDTLRHRLDIAESCLRGLEAAMDNVRLSHTAQLGRHEAAFTTPPSDGGATRLHPDDIHLVHRIVREAEAGILAKAQHAAEPALAHVRQVLLSNLQSSETLQSKAVNAVALDLSHLRDTNRRDLREAFEKIHSLRADVQRALSDVCRSVGVVCPVV